MKKEEEDIMHGIMHKEKIHIVWLIVVISLAILIFLSRISENELPKPIEGKLNLSSWDSNNGRPSLAGEWEFYWNKLYTYSDFQAGTVKGKQYVQIPKTWNSYTQNGNALSGSGYATYRLQVNVNNLNQPLSVRIDTISTAYRLYINGQEVASNGQIGVDQLSSIPGYEPIVANFQPTSTSFDIIVQVSNYSYARGGIWYEINFGTQKQIEALNTMILYKDAILIGSLLIMALYYMSFYIVLQRDKSSFYFILLCVIFIIRTSLYGSVMIVRLIPAIPYEVLIFLTYATLYWIPIVLFLMISSIYESPVPARKSIMIYGLTATILTGVMPIRVYTKYVSSIEIIGICIVLLSVFVVVRAYRRCEKGAGVILLSVILIFIAGIHDILFQANLIQHNWGEMASIGIFFFILGFSFIIASRLSDAYNQEKILTLQLGESLNKEKTATDEMIKSELAFLKAQIKPHFLYNSLSVIAALSTKNPMKTKELLYDLADYLRGSFNFENYNGITPIETEIATIKAYLAIEKERFQGKLNIIYDIDESIVQSIPLLTIQPLVENALRHGILKKSGGGTVSLSIQKKNSCIVIEVQDDGVGMSGEKIDTICNEPGEVIGVGLKNIHRRLILHYGQGLEIISEEGKGTTVTFSIPREEKCDQC